MPEYWMNDYSAVIYLFINSFILCLYYERRFYGRNIYIVLGIHGENKAMSQCNLI
jgi:hypothetical protein